MARTWPDRDHRSLHRRTVPAVASERILLVEDDERIGSTLIRALEATGYAATWVGTGADAITAASRERPELVLLDLGLPDLDGLEVCRRIHAADATISIMMLAARDEELDIVVGLDSGAIDYVTKPFRLAELLARIRAQLRQLDPAPPSTTSGDLVVDTAARRVWVAGEEL